jgi:hypothetical protein
MIRTLAAISLAFAMAPLDIVTANGEQMNRDEVAQKIVGAWRYVGTSVDGVPRNRGAHPTGMIVYTASGHMSVQIAPDRPRTKAGPEATPDEAKAAIADYVAYFGTYTIDDRGVITHHRQASLQPGDAAAVVRAPEFKGDRMILRPPNSKQEIVWERIK